MTPNHPARPLPRLAALVLLLGLLTLAGCYQSSENGDAKTYHFAVWVPLVVGVLGILAFLGGIAAFRRWSKQLGVLLMLMGPAMLLLIAPAVFLNKAVVDDKHFESRDGIWWWSMERQEANFDDVVGAHLSVTVTQTRNAGEVKKYTLELLTKSGSKSIVVRNSLKAAWPEIARRVRQRPILGADKIPETLGD